MKSTNVYKNIWICPGVEVQAEVDKIANNKQSVFGKKEDIGILDVADDFPEARHHKDTLYIHAGLNDGPEDWNKPYGDDNSEEAYRQAIKALEFLALNKKTVLVHCHGGVSRACIVVAGYIAYKNKVPIETVVEYIKINYPRCNPHPKHYKVITQAIKELLE